MTSADVADVAVADDAEPLCPDPPACDLAPPTPSPRTGWVQAIQSGITVALGGQRHRGRDLYLRENEPQWALAKFAYGFNDDDLQDEEVEVFVARDCQRWERLGQLRTTRDGAHATVEGVADTGGWVYFPIPAGQRLGVGRHRVHFVVRGDQTTATQFIEVLPANARMVVSDVDGTLTTSETAEWLAVFGGMSPAVNPGAPEVMWTLARRGFHIFYLSARPDWLAGRTHEWVRDRGLPPGIVHVTLGFTGLTGQAAVNFKSAELMALRTRLGRPVDYAFGNTDTDATAYDLGGVDPARAYYFRFTGERRGGAVNDDYRSLVAPLSVGPRYCH